MLRIFQHRHTQLHRRAGGRRAAGRPRAGFTLVEVLFGLVVLAMLLAAVAAAIQGSLQSYAENARIGEVIQAARVVLFRMMGDIRTAEAVDSTAQEVRIIPPDDGSGVTLIHYELTGGVLYYRWTDGTGEHSTPLVASDEAVKVQNFAISRQTAVDGEGVTYTVSVTARLDLKCGDNPFSATASVCPRRNLSY